MAELETRAGLEFRVAGRTLSGVAMRYGSVSPSHRERFSPGAFGEVRSVPLNIEHDRSMVVLPAESVILNDSPRELSVRAELPPTSAALRLIRQGALSGFSVEFRARQERYEGGIRIVERADLNGIGLVGKPSYPDALAEIRRAQEKRDADTWVRGVILTDGRPKSCKCLEGATPSTKCRKVRFKPQAFRRTVEAVDRGEHNVIAHTGSFRPENVLGDTRSGMLRLDYARPDADFDEEPLRRIVTPGSLLLALVQGVLGGLAGDALARSLDLAPPVVRPIINDAESEYEDDEEEEEAVRTYTDAWIDSVLIKYAADESADGWEYLLLGPELPIDNATDSIPAPPVAYPWL